MTDKLINQLKISAEDKMAQIGCPHRDATSSVLALPSLQEGSRDYQRIVVYVHSLEEMKSSLELILAREAIVENGLIYLIYPKLSNKIGIPGIHRDEIFPFLEVDAEGYVKGMPYKFNRMISVDETYTLIGLKHIPPAKAKSRRSQPSGCVADYVDFIPRLTSVLTEEVRSIFDALTPGYQRGWARYVYSARLEATQKSRLERMNELLLAGYKSIDQAPKPVK